MTESWTLAGRLLWIDKSKLWLRLKLLLQGARERYGVDLLDIARWTPHNFNWYFAFLLRLLALLAIYSFLRLRITALFFNVLKLAQVQIGNIVRPRYHMVKYVPLLVVFVGCGLHTWHHGTGQHIIEFLVHFKLENLGHGIIILLIQRMQLYRRLLLVIIFQNTHRKIMLSANTRTNILYLLPLNVIMMWQYFRISDLWNLKIVL